MYTFKKPRPNRYNVKKLYGTYPDPPPPPSSQKLIPIDNQDSPSLSIVHFITSRRRCIVQVGRTSNLTGGGGGGVTINTPL